jgi:hypothetical protein
MLEAHGLTTGELAEAMLVMQFPTSDEYYCLTASRLRTHDGTCSKRAARRSAEPRPSHDLEITDCDLKMAVSSRSHERIEQRYPAALEVLRVPGNERQPVRERGRRDQHIRLGNAPTSRLARCAQLT